MSRKRIIFIFLVFLCLLAKVAMHHPMQPLSPYSAVFGFAAQSMFRPASLSANEVNDLAIRGFRRPEDLKAEFPTLFRCLQRCHAQTSDHEVCDQLLRHPQWATVSVAHVLERLDLEDRYGKVGAQMSLLAQGGFTAFKQDELTALRRSAAKAQACVEQCRIAHCARNQHLQSERDLKDAQWWVTRILGFYLGGNAHDVEVMFLPFFSANTGVSQSFGQKIFLIVAEQQHQPLRQKMLIFHEAFHQPLWDAFHRAPPLFDELQKSECVFRQQIQHQADLLGYDTWIAFFSENLIRSVTRKVHGIEEGATWKVEADIDMYLRDHWQEVAQGKEFIPQLLRTLTDRHCLKTAL